MCFDPADQLLELKVQFNDGKKPEADWMSGDDVLPCFDDDCCIPIKITNPDAKPNPPTETDRCADVARMSGSKPEPLIVSTGEVAPQWRLALPQQAGRDRFQPTHPNKSPGAGPKNPI